MRVQATNSAARFDITTDGGGIVSHAGVALLRELADRLELTRALGRGDRHCGRRRHPDAVVLRDLAVMLADGGDCLSDLAILRDQPELFGPVASTPTAWRVVERLATDPDGLARIRAARAHARARAWRSGGSPDPEAMIVIDLDGTLVISHADDKEGAAGTFKHTFGFHPLLAYLDRGDGTGEALAGVLRPGNATANATADLIEVAELARVQLPAEAADQPLLVRTDTAGTAGLAWHLHHHQLRYSLGLEIDEHVREAILALPGSVWRPTLEPDGSPRPGGQVAELTGWIDLKGWPPGTRAICRRERAHPGAQLRFTDHDGHRFQVLVTDQTGELAALELRHRQRARVEDRIRCAKATGLRNLPFDRFRRNAVWLELVLAAQDLTCWLQALLLDGELAVAEPKTLRYRLLHVAARVVRHARRVTLRLQRSWPWATALASAFARLRALPLRC